MNSLFAASRLILCAVFMFSAVVVGPSPVLARESASIDDIAIEDNDEQEDISENACQDIREIDWIDISEKDLIFPSHQKPGGACHMHGTRKCHCHYGAICGSYYYCAKFKTCREGDRTWQCCAHPWVKLPKPCTKEMSC